VIALRVHGADDAKSAETIAKTVAASPLVKTAITGGDPNWGRIVSAAGYAGARINPDLTSLQICGQTIYENGSPQAFDESALSKRMRQSSEVTIDLQVGDGPGEVEFWSSDLTTQYVQFNSEYTT
jgi:glutamate N-acetyltransferase/amino-acid N-acetyltransferase